MENVGVRIDTLDAIHMRTRVWHQVMDLCNTAANDLNTNFNVGRTNGHFMDVFIVKD